MGIVRRIALPCGLVGGVWSLLAPILIVLPVGTRIAAAAGPAEAPRRGALSIIEMGLVAETLPALVCIALMGLLGLMAIILIRRQSPYGRLFLWISAGALLAFSFLSIFNIGQFFLPASILLILSAAGMEPRPPESVLEHAPS